MVDQGVSGKLTFTPIFAQNLELRGGNSPILLKVSPEFTIILESKSGFR
jgi:hypothetical protein